jgi:hypothetical protein
MDADWNADTGRVPDVSKVFASVTHVTGKKVQ